ncbi:DUF4326 domain-containing protein (plasmid) [Methylomarinum sp. Ch1-1]|uniref:DUF4326 domain-containing protein n=1 Tax=Methylomarinum roseum TaxID=3067653 RepID=A0AAU7P075_9GAMM|nr:DUF4326 domain-containing protein [Methylomarinum sp. Ch1-1]MDP4523256.1 DUF4326 domain-containing protein [Methylomarinum sp. Ch1-1]
MKVLNKKHYPKISSDDIYIGRGSQLGNPHQIGPDGDRDTVLARYEHWLNEQIDSRNPIVMSALLSLHEDSQLLCYCAPSPCHGEIIDRIWQERIKPILDSPERNLAYAGIGARATADPTLRFMQALAGRLDELGFTLRSGGADGADSAFNKGASNAEVFLPWPGFNKQKSVYDSPSLEAYRLAAYFHPAWKRLKPSVQSLMARNCHQVLGANLRSPSDFVVCWTLDGAETRQSRTQATGGTGLAIALADSCRIPVFNLKNPDAMARLKTHIESHPEYHPKQTLGG